MGGVGGHIGGLPFTARGVRAARDRRSASSSLPSVPPARSGRPVNALVIVDGDIAVALKKLKKQIEGASLAGSILDDPFRLPRTMTSTGILCSPSVQFARRDRNVGSSRPGSSQLPPRAPELPEHASISSSRAAGRQRRGGA